MCKAMGMNTICLYVFWNIHEQKMDEFDFKGQNDIREFCELAQKNGTGHGVGYLLNIHEGPAGFRYTYRAGESDAFQPGMVITDEPGIYIEGSHGVRLENELLVCEGEKNEYGEFLYFEPITYVPFDLDAINPDIMNAEDKERLNTYHATVYEKVSPYLNDEEKEWLKKYTRAI